MALPTRGYWAWRAFFASLMASCCLRIISADVLRVLRGVERLRGVYLDQRRVDKRRSDRREDDLLRFEDDWRRPMELRVLDGE